MVQKDERIDQQEKLIKDLQMKMEKLDTASKAEPEPVAGCSKDLPMEVDLDDEM